MKRRKNRSHRSDSSHKQRPPNVGNRPEDARPAVEADVAAAVEVLEEPYAEFGHWLDGQLAALEERFAHMMTPRSQKQVFNRRITR